MDVSANRTKVTYWASLGKSIVPIVFFHKKRNQETLHLIIYGGRHLTNMEERIFT